MSNEWGIKKCPLVDRQCIEDQCAWWIEGDNTCAIKKIAVRGKDE
ncbi:MAG: hypothetical protein WBD00_02200 [Candidatus Omnitrophota bacterium]|jgi:hypothetical protein